MCDRGNPHGVPQGCVCAHRTRRGGLCVRTQRSLRACVCVCVPLLAHWLSAARGDEQPAQIEQLLAQMTERR